MGDDSSFLVAIDADPDNDAPRLAHADWLEANGDPERAAFIRAQLAGEAGDSWRWRAGLPVVHGMVWQCRRGYPEMVRFESLTAFKKGWPLTVGHRVRHVQFWNLRGSKLADEPALASIASLDLSYLERDAVLAVLRSPHLGRLRHLRLAGHGEEAGFLAEVVGLPSLSGLRSLHYDLGYGGLTELSMAALAASPFAGGLHELRIEEWLTPEAMRVLWRSSAFARLAVLELATNSGWHSQVTRGGLEELADGAATPALERFAFNDGTSGKLSGQAVADATRWTRLRRLDLGRTGLDDAGAAALAGAGHLAGLERLVLRLNRISDSGAAALAASHLRSLSHLDLSGNVIGRAGVAALGRSERLSSLRTLVLGGNPASPALIEAVEARFRDNGPPVEEAAPVPATPVAPAPSAPIVGAADEDGLVRAILADPWDHAARLAYSDWLEEQGSPIHAAVLRAEAANRSRLAERLWTAMRADPPCPFTPTLDASGLVSIAVNVRALRSKKFERDGPAWLRRHHVAEVRPAGNTKDWEGLFAADWLAHTRALSFADRSFTALDALAGSPHLAGLASLVFGTNLVYDDPFAAFFRKAGLRGLCRLARPGIYMPMAALEAIADAPFAANLRCLEVGIIHDRELAWMSASPAFAGLVTLACYVSGDSGAKTLADAEGLASLRNLDLSGGWFQDVGLEALAGSALLSRLRRLRFDARPCSPAALERLARAASPRCRIVVVLQDEADRPRREALSAILGDRLVIES